MAKTILGLTREQLKTIKKALEILETYRPILQPQYLHLSNWQPRRIDPYIIEGRLTSSLSPGGTATFAPYTGFQTWATMANVNPNPITVGWPTDGATPVGESVNINTPGLAIKVNDYFRFVSMFECP